MHQTIDHETKKVEKASGLVNDAVRYQLPMPWQREEGKEQQKMPIISEKWPLPGEHLTSFSTVAKK